MLQGEEDDSAANTLTMAEAGVDFEVWSADEVQPGAAEGITAQANRERRVTFE